MKQATDATTTSHAPAGDTVEHESADLAPRGRSVDLERLLRGRLRVSSPLEARDRAAISHAHSSSLVDESDGSGSCGYETSEKGRSAAKEHLTPNRTEAVSRETPRPISTRTIAIVNQKGGVGKSTTAVNLGAALALLGHRTLVLDLDPQGNATSGFGVDRRTVAHDAYAVLLGDVSVADARIATEIAGLDVLPATIDLAGAEIELVAVLSRETRLRRALAPIAAEYAYVLIDCPPSLGLLTLNALTAASEVLIPVQAEYYALEGLSMLTKVVGRIREALNPDLEITGVLVTMFDGRTKLAAEVLDEVNRYFPKQLFRTQIPRNVRLSEAPSFGKPAVQLDPKSRGALAYTALAREVDAQAGVAPGRGA